MPGITAAEVLRRAGVAPSRLTSVMPRVRPDEVPVRVAPAWLRAWWARGIKAMTLPWAIYVDPAIWQRVQAGDPLQRNARLVVHELMHVEQVRRAGALRHTLRYAIDYLRGRARGLGHWDAYRDIPSEREARAAARWVMEYQ